MDIGSGPTVGAAGKQEAEDPGYRREREGCGDLGDGVVWGGGGMELAAAT